MILVIIVNVNCKLMGNIRLLTLIEVFTDSRKKTVTVAVRASFTSDLKGERSNLSFKDIFIKAAR